MRRLVAASTAASTITAATATAATSAPSATAATAATNSPSTFISSSNSGSFTHRDAQWVAVILFTIGLWMIHASYMSLIHNGPLQATSTYPLSKNSAIATKKVRVLVGIFTADTESEIIYRQRHRDLISVWNDSRVCTLHEFRQLSYQEQRHDSDCELIYTFVMGRTPGMVISTSTTGAINSKSNSKRSRSSTQYDYGDYASLSTIRVGTAVDNKRGKKLPPPQQQPLPLEVNMDIRMSSQPIDGVIGPDINTMNDITLLNLQENMNDGKSPSWLHFASSLQWKDDDAATLSTPSGSSSTAQSQSRSPLQSSPSHYMFDYVMKCDSDAMLSLHDYFRFAYSTSNHMPPAPYNAMTLIASPIQKNTTGSQWGQTVASQEAYYQEHYYGTHFYASGELYIYSTDLAQKVAAEARRWWSENAIPGKSSSSTSTTSIVPVCPYCAQFEDHDTTSMAFYATGALTSIPDRGGIIDDGFNVPQQIQQQRDRSQGLYTDEVAKVTNADVQSSSTTKLAKTRSSRSTKTTKQTGRLVVQNRNQPIRFVILGVHHKFWQHWVKQGSHALYQHLYEREQARMAGQTSYMGEAIFLTPPQ